MEHVPENRKPAWAGRISPQIRTAGLSALIFGILAHGTALFQKLSFHDDIRFLFDVGGTVTSGRWMLHLLAWLEKIFYLDGHFSLPMYNGFLGILCIAAAACLLTDLLKLRSLGCCAALGCAMVAFPAITGLFAYVYTLHFYMFAMLAAVLAAWLLCRVNRWWAWAAAIVLGGCSVGVYQAYFPLIPAILILDDLRTALETDQPLSGFLKRVLIQLVCMAAAMGFYLLANRYFLNRFQVEMLNYMGLSEVGTATLSDYLARLGRAYREFFLPSRGTEWDMYPGRLYTFYQIMLLGDLLLAGRLLARAWKKSRIRCLLAAVLLAAFPAGVNLIFVMGEEIHGLMTYAQVLQVLLFLFLLDRNRDFRLPSLRRVLAGASALVLGLSCLLYARYANECYLKITFEQQEAISWFTTLITQIKSSEDYRADRPVLFLNGRKVTDPTVTHIPEFDSITIMPYQFTTQEFLSDYAWVSVMERWCGFTPVYSWDYELEELPEVKALPHYPDPGSIQVVQDVLIVNF